MTRPDNSIITAPWFKYPLHLLSNRSTLTTDVDKRNFFTRDCHLESHHFFSQTLSDSLACLRHLCSRLSNGWLGGRMLAAWSWGGEEFQVLHVFAAFTRMDGGVGQFFTRAIIMECSLPGNWKAPFHLSNTGVMLRRLHLWDLKEPYRCGWLFWKSENCYSQKLFLSIMQLWCDMLCLLNVQARPRVYSTPSGIIVSLWYLTSLWADACDAW